MRPNKLKIQAFGPFNQQVEIDFDKFNQGLFLISGHTGSGKSTIFDALTFALFNEASGNYKEPSMFRSGFADEQTETYVELMFSHLDKNYKIIRTPSYMRKKKKGDGYTPKAADASLYEDDQLITTGSNAVTSKVEQLLGLKVNQFKQISMIAQGEFLKLLLTKSSERVEIFRKIFKTEGYVDLQIKLKNKYLEIENQYKNIEHQLKYINNRHNTDMTCQDLLKYITEQLDIFKDQYTNLNNTNKQENNKLERKTVV